MNEHALLRIFNNAYSKSLMSRSASERDGRLDGIRAVVEAVTQEKDGERLDWLLKTARCYMFRKDGTEMELDNRKVIDIAMDAEKGGDDGR